MWCDKLNNLLVGIDPIFCFYILWEAFPPIQIIYGVHSAIIWLVAWHKDIFSILFLSGSADFFSCICWFFTRYALDGRWGYDVSMLSFVYQNGKICLHSLWGWKRVKWKGSAFSKYKGSFKTKTHCNWKKIIKRIPTIIWRWITLKSTENCLVRFCVILISELVSLCSETKLSYSLDITI